MLQSTSVPQVLAKLHQVCFMVAGHYATEMQCTTIECETPG